MAEDTDAKGKAEAEPAISAPRTSGTDPLDSPFVTAALAGVVWHAGELSAAGHQLERMGARLPPGAPEAVAACDAFIALIVERLTA